MRHACWSDGNLTATGTHTDHGLQQMTKQSVLRTSSDQAEKDDARELDLLGIIARLWKSRWLGVAFVLIFLGLGSLYLHNATYTYTAELMLTPTERNTPSNLSSLSSLVGVNLGNDEGSGFAMYEEAMKSYVVAERLSRDPRIMHTVFEGTWDQRSERWREPQSLISTAISAVKGMLGAPRYAWQPPNAQDLQEFISTSVIARADKIKSVTTLSFNHKNRQFSVYFLNKLNHEADNFLRQKSLIRSTLYIEYIRRRLEEVNINDYRQSLLDQLRFYEKMRMMASSNVSFAADAFGEAQASQRPTYPKPSVILLISMAFGFMSWVAYVLILRGIFEKVRD